MFDCHIFLPMPFISVIIPVYNSDDTLKECVKSVLNQSFSDIEVIVVNDGSKDVSGGIADDFAEKDKRVKVIHQENLGRTMARWNGVKEAKGEWVAFVDSDDTLPVNALKDLAEMADDSTDIVFGNGFTVFVDERSVVELHEFRKLAVRADGTIGVPWGSLYRRSILTYQAFDVPREIYNGEDYIFWLNIIFKTDMPVKVVNHSVYNKGEEHTASSFFWTADYAYKLNEFRKKYVPAHLHKMYMPEMIEDRLTNLFAVTLCQPRRVWQNSQFYKDILADMKECGINFTFKQRLFLSLPSIALRKTYSKISEILH